MHVFKPPACSKNAELTIRELSTSMGKLRLILIAVVAVVGMLAGASVSTGAPHLDAQEVVSQASDNATPASRVLPAHSWEHAHETLCLPQLPLRRKEPSPGRHWLVMIPAVFTAALGSSFERPPRDTA